MGSELVSIIVLAFDNFNHLFRSVETLYHNNEYPNFEMIVVHNPSGIGADEKIEEASMVWKKNWSNFKYIKNEKNLYHGKGSMEGVKIADSDSTYICFCNDDVFIPASQSDWLLKMVDFMNNNQEVATLTPSLYSAKERIYWVGKTNPEDPYHDLLHTPRGDPSIPKEPRDTCYNNFSVCLVRKFLVDEIPLGQNCPHYGSDSEFCNRIKEKYPDMKHMVLPEVRLYHYNIFSSRCNYGKNKETEG